MLQTMSSSGSSKRFHIGAYYIYIFSCGSFLTLSRVVQFSKNHTRTQHTQKFKLLLLKNKYNDGTELLS